MTDARKQKREPAASPDALNDAERERRAKVIHAEGEQQAAEKLLEAATTLAQQPQAMQLGETLVLYVTSNREIPTRSLKYSLIIWYWYSFPSNRKLSSGWDSFQ